MVKYRYKINSSNTQMKVSSALQSQILTKYIVADILIQLGRDNWLYKYNTHDLEFEFWTTGVWVKQAGTIISYAAIADYWRELAAMQAEQLPLHKTTHGWLVRSRQEADKKYYVNWTKKYGWVCECMRYRCWKNRIPNELPQLYKALGNKVFCHHVAAAYYARE